MSELKTCKEFCDRLSDYLDGEIGEHECRLIADHLSHCPPCAQAYEALKLTVEVCCKGVAPAIPDDVCARLKAFLREQCKP